MPSEHGRGHLGVEVDGKLSPSALAAAAWSQADACKNEGNAHLKAARREDALGSYALALAILADCRDLIETGDPGGIGGRPIACSEQASREGQAQVWQ